GLEYNPDFNGEKQEGVGYYRQTIYKGRRWSSARAYLGPAARRSNFEILTEANVQRVIIKDGKAVGVEYERGGSSYTVSSTREVILSAGVFGSPKILELSGIGDQERLRSLGIHPV